jgi:hypothetical protein
MNSIKLLAERLISAKWFELSITIIILINSLLIGVETYVENDTISLIQGVILGIFTFEILARFIAADGIKEQVPGIDTWLLAGHSLGGVAASDYLSRHESEYDGIILLGAYAAADLSDYEGIVALVYGSNDGVMNRAKYEEAKSNLPGNIQEMVIEGGNHASFGNYGDQSGDGAARITRDEQQDQVAAFARTL